MIEIKLSQNQVTIIDEESLDVASKYHWHADYDKKLRKFYAKTDIRVNGLRKKLRLHRLVMNAQKGDVIDHINGNTLDNRLSNLRKCTVSENAKNRSLNKNNTSGYKGAVWHAPTQKYQARIYVNGKWRSMGMHAEAKDAARAYNEAAKKYFGEYAKLNVIPD